MSSLAVPRDERRARGRRHAPIALSRAEEIRRRAPSHYTGNVANGLSPDAPRQYVSLNKKAIHSVPVRASEAGELWVLVGTESGFEATTTLYYQSIDVKLVPIADRVE